jgi:hypothetical protein
MPSEKPVRMKLRITQSKIDRVRALLGTKSDTETVERALDFVISGGPSGGSSGGTSAGGAGTAQPSKTGPQP